MSNSLRKVLYIGSLTSMITVTFAFGRYIFAAITPDIVASLHLDYEFVGTINAAHQLLYLLFSLLGGLLSASVGPRFLICLSGALSSLGMIGLFAADNKWLLLGIFALQGICSALSWVPMVELVSESVDEKERGVCLGIISSGTSYGLILNGVLIPPLLERYDWHAVWLVYGLLSVLISAVAIALISSEKKRVKAATQSIQAQLPSLAPEAGNGAQSVRLMTYILQGTLMFLTGLHMVPYQSYIVSFMQIDLNASRAVANISWTLFGILGIVSGFFAGWLADRLSAKKAMVITYGISSLSILLLVCFRTPVFALISCGLFGLTYNGIFSLHPTYISRMLPPRATAKLFGLFNLLLGFGSMAGNYAGGAIENARGSFALTYVLIFVASVVAIVVSLILRSDRAASTASAPALQANCDSL